MHAVHERAMQSFGHHTDLAAVTVIILVILKKNGICRIYVHQTMKEKQYNNCCTTE